MPADGSQPEMNPRGGGVSAGLGSVVDSQLKSLQHRHNVSHIFDRQADMLHIFVKHLPEIPRES